MDLKKKKRKKKPKKGHIPGVSNEPFFLTVYLDVSRVKTQGLGNKPYQNLGGIQNHMSILAKGSWYQEMLPSMRCPGAQTAFIPSVGISVTTWRLQTHTHPPRHSLGCQPR